MCCLLVRVPDPLILPWFRVTLSCVWWLTIIKLCLDRILLVCVHDPSILSSFLVVSTCFWWLIVIKLCLDCILLVRVHDPSILPRFLAASACFWWLMTMKLCLGCIVSRLAPDDVSCDFTFLDVAFLLCCFLDLLSMVPFQYCLLLIVLLSRVSNCYWSCFFCMGHWCFSSACLFSLLTCECVRVPLLRSSTLVPSWAAGRHNAGPANLRKHVLKEFGRGVRCPPC